MASVAGGVFLFDIDGTLMRSGGAGAIAYRRAFQDWSGVDASRIEISMGGRTDREILRLTLEALGLPYPTPPARRRLVRRYLQLLADELAEPKRAEPCPGVAQLLLALAGPANAIGLVTGNIQPGAVVKLSAAGLLDHFEFGAYGNDAENRDELVPIALRRLRRRGSIPALRERAWVIGDTLRDVQCARAAGVRVIAVGTGFEDRQALLESEPDLFFEDLSDTAEVLARIAGLDGQGPGSPTVRASGFPQKQSRNAQGHDLRGLPKSTEK